VRIALSLLLVVSAAANAHVSPSVDDNNRYLKVTPQADRVRVAYTVFFGEVPGAKLRPSLDTNRDGSISDGEAQAYGDRIAADVLAAMEIAVDGKQQRFGWKTVSVGLGSPTVNAGSFSVDMIAYLCLAHARGRHTVRITDRYRVPKPGETEVRVEDGLGIRVERAAIGDASALNNDFKLVGPGGPLSDDGLDIAFDASDKAPLGGEGCVAAVAAPTEKRSYFWIGVIAGVALAVLIAIGLWLRAYFRAS
jgi:hypothetical protein